LDHLALDDQGEMAVVALSSPPLASWSPCEGAAALAVIAVASAISLAWRPWQHRQ